MRRVLRRKPLQLALAENARMPNSVLPVLIYPQVLSGEDLEGLARDVFRSNGWSGAWAAGIYGYHHFHSNAHEALAVVAGQATLILGGAEGTTVAVAAGDVLVLPAGTGHRRIRDSWDFWVVGAYPAGQEEYDEYLRKQLCANYRGRIDAVRLPECDPLYGGQGPLLKLWGAKAARD